MYLIHKVCVFQCLTKQFQDLDNLEAFFEKKLFRLSDCACGFLTTLLDCRYLEGPVLMHTIKLPYGSQRLLGNQNHSSFLPIFPIIQYLVVV